LLGLVGVFDLQLDYEAALDARRYELLSLVNKDALLDKTHI